MIDLEWKNGCVLNLIRLTSDLCLRLHGLLKTPVRFAARNGIRSNSVTHSFEFPSSSSSSYYSSSSSPFSFSLLLLLVIEWEASCKFNFTLVFISISNECTFICW